MLSDCFSYSYAPIPLHWHYIYIPCQALQLSFIEAILIASRSWGLQRKKLDLNRISLKVFSDLSYCAAYYSTYKKSKGTDSTFFDTSIPRDSQSSTRSIACFWAAAFLCWHSLWFWGTWWHGRQNGRLYHAFSWRPNASANVYGAGCGELLQWHALT